jgi:hypothetical protein
MTLVGFDPSALALLLKRWKARRADADPLVAAQWQIAVQELSLVIAASPQATPQSGRRVVLDVVATTGGKATTETVTR